MPIFAKIAVSAAKQADKAAQKNQPLEVVMVCSPGEARGPASDVARPRSCASRQRLLFRPAETSPLKLQRLRLGDSNQTECGVRKSNSARASPPVLPMMLQ
jgi:hypothetical protein